MNEYFEVNCDGLVGPSHNYGGLAQGNLASKNNKSLRSYPKSAALEALGKMKILMDLGLKQIIFPPAPRPILHALHSLGYDGNTDKLLNNTTIFHLASVYSASSMWAANSSIVTPSIDSKDKKLHFTPSNLSSHFHRSLESSFTYLLLKEVFNFDDCIVHKPLESSLPDEGAANHMRFIRNAQNKGVHVFVYGHSIQDNVKHGRQSKETFEAIIKNHSIQNAILVQQTSEAISKGVFHNDVIAMSHKNILIAHESSYFKQEQIIHDLRVLLDNDFQYFEVNKADLTIEMAVKTYFFNSQLFFDANNQLNLLMPIECNVDTISTLVEKIREKIKIDTLLYINIKESMRNGGGPACLRLRVDLNNRQWQKINPNYILTQEKYNILSDWIHKHYRDFLDPEDLRDPLLIKEIKKALVELSDILNTKIYYEFLFSTPNIG